MHFDSAIVFRSTEDQVHTGEGRDVFGDPRLVREQLPKGSPARRVHVRPATSMQRTPSFYVIDLVVEFFVPCGNERLWSPIWTSHQGTGKHACKRAAGEIRFCLQL